MFGVRVLHLALTDRLSTLTTAMLASLVTGSTAGAGDFCKESSLPWRRRIDGGSDAVEELTRDTHRRVGWTPEEASGRAVSG